MAIGSGPQRLLEHYKTCGGDRQAQLMIVAQQCWMRCDAAHSTAERRLADYCKTSKDYGGTVEDHDSEE